MTNVFKRMAQNSSALIVFLWPLGVLIMIATFLIMIEDYNTSRLGYLLLPTQKYSLDWVAIAVALLPQGGQILLFYMFVRDTKKGIYLLGSAGFFLVDFLTDVVYKTNATWDLGLIVIAALETFFIFNLCSEVLFTISAGFVLEAAGEFVAILGAVFGSLKEGFSKFITALGMTDSDDRRM